MTTPSGYIKLLNVKIKILENGIGLPKPFYATGGSAGADIYAAIDNSFILRAGQRAIVGSGIALELSEGYEVQIRPRSGLAAKNGITVLNSPGTIDSDYRGEIKVIIINTGDEDFFIERGMKIAQLVVAPVIQAEFIISDELEETERNDGGLGSTGI